MSRLPVYIIFALMVSGMTRASSVGERVRVVLTNGDLITGQLIERTEGSVRVESVLLGVLTIDSRSIARVDEEKGDREVLVSESSAATSDEAKELVRAKADKKAESKSELKKGGSYVAVLPNWKKRVEFGVGTQSGRKAKSDFSLLYKMERQVGSDRFLGEYRYLYGKTEEDVTTDKVNSKFRWRHDIAPGVFYETNSSYNSDVVKNVNYILSQKLGLGYRFVESAAFRLSSGLGASLRLRDDEIRVNEREELFDLFQDLEYKFNGKLKISQDLRFATQANDANFYEIGFRAAVISSFTKTLNLTIRYEVEYDNSLPNDDREERRLMSSLGYDF